VQVSGKTYEFREQLKSVGGKWNPELKNWSVPKGVDIEFLKPKQKEKYTRPIPSYGQCCRKAKLEFEREQGPLVYVCHLHGRRYTTKMGAYTGD
jgi:hypothetical protein